MPRRTLFPVAVVVALMAGTAGVALAAMDEPIQPIAPAKVNNPGLVELGKKLFFDTRLSKSGFISCNSCHTCRWGAATT